MEAAVDSTDIFDLKGRTAVITGAGGELAGAIARGLGERGVNIAVLDINGKKAEECAGKIREAGGTAAAFCCDVLNRSQLEDCGEKISTLWGDPDLLLNGAGGNHPKASTEMEFASPETAGMDWPGQNFFNLDLDGVKAAFALNYYGTLLPTQVFSRSMIEKGKGSIVNISSMNAFTPLTKIPAYSAAKSAVSNFTKWLSVHFSHAGVRVNAIAPGFFMTEQLRFLHIDQTTGEYTPRAKKVIAHTPMGRYGEPEELLGTAVWLFSDASRFVTGAVIPVDGGFSSYAI
jgi:NAD(P)-dependent dehydrogenase (short-subunit alcohol dehydrogenase family)